MPRDGEPKSRVHLWLHDRDLERLDTVRGIMTRSAAIQLILHSYLDKLDAVALGKSRAPVADISNIIDGVEHAHQPPDRTRP
jgi:hypothetical protein